MLPIFTSPRARGCSSAALRVRGKGVVPSKRARDSAFGKGETRDGGGEAGTEKPTTDEAGSKELDAEAAPASQDVDDSFRTGGINSGTGDGVGVCAGVDAVDRISLVSRSAHGTTIF